MKSRVFSLSLLAGSSPSSSDETRTEVTVRYLQRRLASVRFTGRGRAGFCNSRGALRHWSVFRAPHHACKQAARCFTNAFDVLLWLFAHHVEQHAQERLNCPTKILKD